MTHNRKDEIAFDNFLYRVVKAVKPYTRYMYKTDLNDLFQEGCLGLLEAINDFDKNGNVPFQKFADRYIYKSLKSFYRQQIDSKRFIPIFISFESERIGAGIKTYLEQEEDYLEIRQAIFLLTPKQRVVIEQVYGFQCQPVSLSKIAVENRTSHEAVRKTHKRGLLSLSQNPSIQALAS